MFLVIQTLLLVLTAVYLLYIYLARNHSHWRKKGVVFLKPIPLFGNALNVYLNIQSPGHLAYKIYKSMDAPLIGYFLGNRPHLVVKDLEVIKSVLVKDSSYFQDHVIICDKSADETSANFLFLLKGAEWKDLRKKASPQFSPGKLKQMFTSVAECATDFLEYLNRTVGKNNNYTWEARSTCEKFAIDAVMLSFFGIRPGCCKNDKALFYNVTQTAFNWKFSNRALSINYLYLSSLIVRLFKLKFMDEINGTFLHGVLWDAMIEREESGSVRNDLLDIMVTMKKAANIQDKDEPECKKITALAIQILVAGYETIASGTAFVLYEMALNQDIQNKAKKEMFKAKEAHGDITYDSLQEMPYLQMCIKEGLRKYPTLPYAERMCNRDYVIKEHDVIVERGTGVFVSIKGLHYDERYFPDAQRFDPLRFSEENIHKIPDYTYMPFGKGPRVCIGERFGQMAMQCGLAYILSNYSFSVNEDTPQKVQFYKNGFTMFPESQIKLSISKLVK